MTKVLEQLRKIAFWTVDTLKGGGIRRHYFQLKMVMANPDSKEAKEIRNLNLAKILQHAAKTVPFYSNINTSAEGLCLQDFPIIDKQLIRENFEDFRSIGYRDKHNHAVLTSGSTGKPFKILHDRNKRDRNTADTLFFAKRAGFELGSKLYYLRLWDKQYQKNRLLSFVQNISTYSVDDLNEQTVGELVKALDSDRGSINILAYSSALDTICKHLDKHYSSKPLHCKMKSVIAMAEALKPDTRDKIQTYFSTRVVSRYSNSENGIFAQQKVDGSGDDFEINWASYHIEILDLNEDKPVAMGELGRLVVTDYFNFAMPMVRYDTGDVGIMDIDPKTGELVLSKIDGRKMDMFTNTKGEYISSHIIHHILQFNGIDQFQFVEEENNEYIIKLKVSQNLDERDENELRNLYRDYFGEDAIITIQYVEDIPLLPSGKRKLVINKAIEKFGKPQKKVPV